MFDPLTVAGTAALTEGVKFLYAQVTELLRRRREAAESGGGEQTVTAPGVTSSVLDGPLAETTVPAATLSEVEPMLREVRHHLADYAQDLATVREDDRTLADAAERARGLLEVLYRQHVTFAAERGRPPTGTALSATDVDNRVGSITASGVGAIAAHTLSAPSATTGGFATSSDVHGSVNVGERRTP